MATKIQLSLATGDYARLYDNLLHMATQEAVMEDAQDNNDTQAYEDAMDAHAIASHAVSDIVRESLTGELRRDVERHIRRIKKERDL